MIPTYIPTDKKQSHKKKEIDLLITQVSYFDFTKICGSNLAKTVLNVNRYQQRQNAPPFKRVMNKIFSHIFSDNRIYFLDIKHPLI